MSDPQASKPEAPIGEPVAEPRPTEDVVDRANGSLAEAEAARDGVPVDAAGDSGSVSAVPADDVHERAAEPAPDGSYGPDSETDVVTPVRTDAGATTDETPWYDRPEHLQPAGATTPETHETTRTADTTVAAPVAG